MLGYIAYALICGFAPLQLFTMIRGGTDRLGRLPLFSLAVGLTLLQVQLVMDDALNYLLIGNAVSCVFTWATIVVGYWQYQRQRREAIVQELHDRLFKFDHPELLPTVAIPMSEEDAMEERAYLNAGIMRGTSDGGGKRPRPDRRGTGWGMGS